MALPLNEMVYDIGKTMLAQQLSPHLTGKAPVNLSAPDTLLGPSGLLQSSSALSDAFYRDPIIRRSSSQYTLRQDAQFLGKTRSISVEPPQLSSGVGIRAISTANDTQKSSVELLHLANRIASYRQAYSRRREDDTSIDLLQDLGDSLFCFGNALIKTAIGRKEVANLTKAIAALQESCELPARSSNDRPRRCTALGSCLTLKYDACGDVSDLEKAIDFHRLASRLCGSDETCQSDALQGLVKAFYSLYLCKNDAQHLSTAIEASDQLLSLHQNGHPGRMPWLNELSTLLLTRYHKIHLREDLDRAIVLVRELIELNRSLQATPVTTLHCLANHLTLRFDVSGSLLDLQESNAALREALRLSNEGSEAYLHSLTLLAKNLRLEFEVKLWRETIDESVSLFITALRFTPTGHALAFHTYAEYALSLFERFKVYGSEDDFDSSILFGRRAVALCPSQHLSQGLILGKLSGHLLWRYRRRGLVDDLDEALSLSQAAVELCASDVQRTSAMADYMFAIMYSARDRGFSSHHDESIRAFWFMISQLEQEDHSRVESFCILGQLLRIRFEQRGYIDDLEWAIKIGSAAVDSYTPSRNIHARCLIQHAKSLIIWSQLTEDISDLTVAHTELLSALQVCSAGHPKRAEAIATLFSLHCIPQTPFHDSGRALSYLKEAIEDGCAGAHARVRIGMDGLREFMQKTKNAELNDIAVVLDLYLATVRLLPRVAMLGYDLRTSIGALQTSEGLASDAACYAVHLQKLDLAIEVLEHGRAAFWSQALRLRTPLDKLPVAFREELGSLIHAVDMEMLTVRPGEKSKSVQEEEAQLRRKRLERMDELLLEVRQLPGLEQFLLPPSLLALAASASRGPVITLITNNMGIFALALLKSGDVVHIPLHSASLTSLESAGHTMHFDMSQLMRGRRHRGRLPEHQWRAAYNDTYAQSTHIFKMLWQDVVHPILKKLRILPSAGRKRPRLWWCPTGPFMFLPLHAAGVYDGSPETMINCSDYVVSSYTPTLSALLKGREGFRPIPRQAIRVLLAAAPMPFETDWPELPGARKEFDQLRDIVPQEMLLPLSPQDDASVFGSSGASAQAIEENITSATILHLSSHGWQNSEDPLGSGFVMRDGMLTIERLMKLSLPNAFLAFLSACETAKGDQKQPNQVIHLAAAMLFTGFRSVIGTMWAIDENDGILIATEFHRRLLHTAKETLDADDVAYALDEAVSALQRSVDHPGRWAAYIHLGI